MEIGGGIEEFAVYMRLARFSACTQKQYLWYLKRLKGYLEEQGSTTTQSVTRRTLRHWSAAATEKWAPATHRQAVCAVKCFFRFLVDEEMLEVNPAKSLVLPEVPRKTQRTLTSEEVTLLLKVIQTFDSPRREREIALVCLLADSGLRSREVCSLQIASLDLEHGMLRVIGKGSKEAVAPFGVTTTAQLKTWFDMRKKWLVQHDLPDPDTVFISVGGLRRGQPLTTDGLRRLFAYLGTDAGVEKLSPNVFVGRLLRCYLRTGLLHG
ncbi:MAG: tyrosine-type recombinase/integrase [Anaerolineae bacterium]|nr:tyrosine-type recombinase/integrase [Anaerolineae bacterium]